MSLVFLALLPSLAAAAEDPKPGPQPAPPVKHRNVQPAISADGRFVAFQSTTRDLLPGDDRGTEHIYVYSREHGWLVRVSIDPKGNPGKRNSYGASLPSPDHLLDGRVPAGVAVLGAEPIENATLRVPLLAMDRLIVLQDLLDDLAAPMPQGGLNPAHTVTQIQPGQPRRHVFQPPHP